MTPESRNLIICGRGFAEHVAKVTRSTIELQLLSSEGLNNHDNREIKCLTRCLPFGAPEPTSGRETTDRIRERMLTLYTASVTCSRARLHQITSSLRIYQNQFPTQDENTHRPYLPSGCLIRALSNLREVAISPSTTHLAGTPRRGGQALARAANRRAPPVPGPAHRGEGDGTGGEMAREAPAT
jgi:hypothetical protein